MSAFLFPEEAENALDDAEKALLLVETLAAQCDRQLQLQPAELYAFCALVRAHLAKARAAARFVAAQE